MLLDFEHWLYTNFIFGKDAEKRVGAELKKDGAHTVLVHHDSGKFLYDNGLLENTKKNLADAGLRVVELGGVKPNPRVSLVREGIALCRAEKVDYILAIGGGSSIDSSKAISVGVNYQGDIWALCSGSKTDASKKLPVSVILTYPATGSESSTGCVITNEDGWLKRGMSGAGPNIRPNIAFMNPELTFSLPPYLTACGVVDMYAHIVERYFAPKTGFGVIDALCEATMRALLTFGPKVLSNPTDYEARAEIMWIGTIAHNNTMGVGRVQDWASHGMGHELSALYDTAHGATLSIMMPAWMRYVYKSDITRFARYAAEVFRIDSKGVTPEKLAQEGIARTEAFFHSLGTPVKFSDAKLPTDRLEEMAKKAASARGTTLGNFVQLTEADVLNIYKDAAK